MVGKNITRLRKRSKLSKAEFADELNAPYSSITQWEQGKYNPSSKSLKKIAQVLNCTVDELLS